MLDELTPCCVLQTFYEAFVALSFTDFPLYFRAVLFFFLFFFFQVSNIYVTLYVGCGHSARGVQ